jgi:hypothetical protein
MIKKGRFKNLASEKKANFFSDAREREKVQLLIALTSISKSGKRSWQ